MSKNDEETWRALEFRYSELRDIVTTMRLETVEEARGRKDAKGIWRETTPMWHDDELGHDVKSWFVIPYIESLDIKDLGERLDFARALVPILDQAFATRQSTAEFLREWGRFSELVGSLAMLLNLETAAVGLRSGAAGGEAVSVNDQREWFGHYMHQFLQETGKKAAALERFHSLVHAIVDGRLQVSFPVQWFEAYIDLERPSHNEDYGRLKRTYTDISKEKYKVVTPRDNLPPLDLVHPLP